MTFDDERFQNKNVEVRRWSCTIVQSYFVSYSLCAIAFVSSFPFLFLFFYKQILMNVLMIRITTLSFNSPQQKIYSYGKNFVAVKKNLDLRILRPQRRIIILCRRIMILETRILVLPPRLIILLRRNSFCLVLFGRILFLFGRQKVLLRRISVLKDLLRRILVLSPRLRILFRRN